MRLKTIFVLGALAALIGLAVLQRSQPHNLFFGVALEGLPTHEALATESASLGISPQIVSFYLQWPTPTQALSNFPVKSLDDIWDSGALPCITWEPVYFADGAKVTVLAGQVVDSSYDAYLTAFAQAAATWNKPLLLRFAHEMNLKEYHWGTTAKDYGPASPVAYVQMYRYVVDLFRLIGAHNVLWVFCPNAVSVPDDHAWNTADAYYPGDHHCDIVGMDGYNWGVSSWSHAQTFKETFSELYQQLQARLPHRPILVFETASVGSVAEKNQWLEEAAHTSLEWGLQGIVWFDVDKEHDWSISLKPEVAKLFTHTMTAQQWAEEMVKDKVKTARQAP